MSIVHISEDIAIRDFAAVLREIDEGRSVIIDRPQSGSVVLSAEPPAKGRTGYEMLAILESLPGERGVMTEDFARDVREFRDRHPEGLDRGLWD